MFLQLINAGWLNLLPEVEPEYFWLPVDWKIFKVCQECQLPEDWQAPRPTTSRKTFGPKAGICQHWEVTAEVWLFVIDIYGLPAGVVPLMLLPLLKFLSFLCSLVGFLYKWHLCQRQQSPLLFLTIYETVLSIFCMIQVTYFKMQLCLFL